MEYSQCSSQAASTGARHGNETGGTEDLEESQDEEPSSINEHHHHNDDELECFRRQWKKEISSPANVNSISPAQKCQVANTPEAVEEQARCLFLSGAQAERSGKLQDAISFYRRAVQLVPDIEFRIDEYRNEYSEDLSSDELDDESTLEDNLSSEEDEKIDNLVSKFQKWAAKTSTTWICKPKQEQKASHISCLPPEIFIYILKWVVSQDLDFLSLEQVAKVCRGFFICARDPEIWKLICLRTWDMNVDTPNNYGSWRNMFIQHPHLSFNGVYISKTTYIRYGESSFQDTNYRPCYLVAYYRYLRFFPEGLVLMLTTPDDPYQSLYKLRHRKFRDPNILSGCYKLVGSNVVAVVKKPKSEATANNYYRYKRQRQVNVQDVCDESFHLELDVKNVKRRNNCQLIWRCYSIHAVHRNGDETVSDFDLNPSKFPSFWFSRVRSFTAESESPLK